MLKHDQPEEQAAKVRVTPEELAAAVAALEARKQGASGTIAIGDAVDELSLDSSPEAILREVHARRESDRGRLRAASRRRKWAISLAASCFCFTGFVVYGEVSNHYPDSSQIIPAATPFALEPRMLALDPAAPRHTISTLAEAPDGRTVYCSVAAIETAAMSRNVQMGPQREISQPPAELNWPVVKYGKDLYVRGWVRMPLSREAAKLADVEVFNRPNLPQLGSDPQQVSFKLDLHTSLMGLGGQRLRPDGTGEFTFHDPRLTAHTYERWRS
jgi:hypothetical protein